MGSRNTTPCPLSPPQKYISGTSSQILHKSRYQSLKSSHKNSYQQQMSVQFNLIFLPFQIYFAEHCRCSCPEVFCQKVVLKNFPKLQENTYAGVSLLIKLQAGGSSTGETTTQVFSCEHFKNTYSHKNHRVANSEYQSFIS